MSNYGWLKTLLMFVIAFAVQSTIGDWLKILGVGPDFILTGFRWMSMRR